MNYFLYYIMKNPKNRFEVTQIILPHKYSKQPTRNRADKYKSFQKSELKTESNLNCS